MMTSSMVDRPKKHWSQPPLRKYIAVLAALVVSAILLSGIEIVIRAIHMPEWTLTLVVFLGGPISVIGLSWLFTRMIRQSFPQRKLDAGDT